MSRTGKNCTFAAAAAAAAAATTTTTTTNNNDMVIDMVGALCRFRKIKEIAGLTSVVLPDSRGRKFAQNLGRKPLVWAIYVVSNAVAIIILGSDARLI
jgi:hypothetical protein